MKNLFNKELVHYLVYVAVALIGIWFLTKMWVPSGYVVAGHDSGLALDAKSFLKTRFFAWDDRIDFGVDNSPHFGSVMLHSIDYALSLFGTSSFAGNQVAVFFWLSMLFIFSSIFSYSLKQKLGRLVPYFFPLFLTFNFFIFQSIFILERAKYELVCVILLFLTFALGILFDRKKPVLRSSIIFSVIFSIFNGGSWLGLPLYGSLFVAGMVYLLFAIIIAKKEKDLSYFRRTLIFCLLSFVFFVLLNMYSILPFISILISSDYAVVVGQGTIAAGKEWLIYISRGTFFINLFRFQGVPEWYLTGGLPNPEYSYAGLYLTNRILVLVSFLLPILSFSGMLFVKEKDKKYLIFFFLFLLLISMFFTAGTNSPLGFVYTALYEKIPGFSIFRSPYFKFATSFIISYSILLAYSLSILGEFIFSKINNLIGRRLKNTMLISGPLFVLTVAVGWLFYNFIMFNRDFLFKWQPDKSTLVKVPEYATEFNNWLKDTNFTGRALMLPAFDGGSGNDNYTWGYWSLSPLPSVLFANGSFMVNDVINNSVESDKINKLFALLLQKSPVFFDVSKKLGINYLFIRSDFQAEDSEVSEEYFAAVKSFIDNDELKLVKTVGPWSLLRIKNTEENNTFRLVNNFFSVPKDHIYISKEPIISKDNTKDWLSSESVNNGLDKLVLQEYYPLNCESCLVENLGKHADLPPVRVLPNSPFYAIKKERNEKILSSVDDENSRLAAHIGLAMTKLSEIRSMIDLQIDKKYINLGLNDLNNYLENINNILFKSNSLKSNFYFASRIYETVNPIQRYFRDYISNSNFGYEKSDIKNNMFKILWQSTLLKKQYDGLIGDGGKWNLNKIYNISLPSSGQYSLLIDKATLPSDNKGGVVIPSDMALSTGQNLNLKNVEDKKWMFTDPAEFPKTGELDLIFQYLPDLFKVINKEEVDFPLGTRGCVIGKINNFNKYRNYVLTLSSDIYLPNMRLYIKENSQRNQSTDEFLRGDIEMDVSLNPDGNSFKYFFDPSVGANVPLIYLCRYDRSIPENVKLNVLEIFNPEIYAVKNNSINVEATTLTYKKIDPTRYNITTNKFNGDMVLIFNQAFNGLWKLTDANGTPITDHFSVNGYENGWLLSGGGRQYDLLLVYQPQELFSKGLKISISSIIILAILYLIAWVRTIKNEKN